MDRDYLLLSLLRKFMDYFVDAEVLLPISLWVKLRELAKGGVQNGDHGFDRQFGLHVSKVAPQVVVEHLLGDILCKVQLSDLHKQLCEEILQHDFDVAGAGNSTVWALHFFYH